MYKCTLCPNKCNVDRESTKGACGVDNTVKIAKYYLHPYEEPLISGSNGSGGVFFSGCSLRCRFCQNFDLSHNARGKEFTINELADIFRQLENMGAHNINLVNPTHYAHKIIEALQIYRPEIPVVWNSHGYETVENLEIIDPYVDIYLPDLKYCRPKRSVRYTGKENYFEVAAEAISFMLEHKKTEIVDGLMKKGVIVRHLILPSNVDESVAILEFLADKIGDNYLSLMSQYTPFGDIENYPELKRKITKREYNTVLEKCRALGFKNVFLQDGSSSGEGFIPDWDF